MSQSSNAYNMTKRPHRFALPLLFISEVFSARFFRHAIKHLLTHF